jgi:hypothetical protein
MSNVNRRKKKEKINEKIVVDKVEESKENQDRAAKLIIAEEAKQKALQNIDLDDDQDIVLDGIQEADNIKHELLAGKSEYEARRKAEAYEKRYNNNKRSGSRSRSNSRSASRSRSNSRSRSKSVSPIRNVPQRHSAGVNTEKDEKDKYNRRKAIKTYDDFLKKQEYEAQQALEAKERRKKKIQERLDYLDALNSQDKINYLDQLKKRADARKVTKVSELSASDLNSVNSIRKAIKGLDMKYNKIYNQKGLVRISKESASKLLDHFNEKKMNLGNMEKLIMSIITMTRISRHKTILGRVIESAIKSSSVLSGTCS